MSGWHDRWLRAWRRDLDGWRGYVRYAVSPGIRYLEWVAAERVREALLQPAVPPRVRWFAHLGTLPRQTR
jgi:hypothetical protein